MNSIQYVPQVPQDVPQVPQFVPQFVPQYIPETADIETSSAAYASRFSGPTGSWLLRVQAEATLSMLQSYPQATILEVGGGHGQLTPHLLKAGHSVTVLGSDKELSGTNSPRWWNQDSVSFKLAMY